MNVERETAQIMRGIAIFLIVAYHAVLALSDGLMALFFHALINRIHVITFFVIAGYFFEKNLIRYKAGGTLSFFKKKFLKLIVPYYIWTVLFSAAVWLGARIPQVYRLLEQEGYGVKSIGPILIDPIFFKDFYFESLWFIYVLFLFFVVNWFWHSQQVTLGVWIGIVAVFAIINHYFDGTVIIESFLVHFQWFLGGRLCWKKKGVIKAALSRKKMQLLCWAVLVFTGVRMFSEAAGAFIPEFHSLEMQILFRCYERVERVAFSSSAVALVYLTASNLIRQEKIGRFLKSTGDWSYNIYIVHNPWIIIPMAIGLKQLGLPWPFGVWFVIAASIAVPVWISIVIKKAAPGIYKILFGG